VGRARWPSQRRSLFAGVRIDVLGYSGKTRERYGPLTSEGNFWGRGEKNVPPGTMKRRVRFRNTIGEEGMGVLKGRTSGGRENTARGSPRGKGERRENLTGRTTGARRGKGPAARTKEEDGAPRTQS